jgi:hypothetical protein
VKGPQGLLVDADGNVFFANTLSMQVWEIESNLAALDFTATPVGQGNVSNAMFQTVENDGNDAAAPLAFTSITAGTNAEIDTSIAAGACATTSSLAVDSECTVGVYFAPAATPASGVVNFFDAGVKIGSGTLTGGTPDIAQFTTSALAVGTHPITATYAGDNLNTATASVAISQVVTQTVTAVAIAASPNPGIAGVPEAITATVTVTQGAGTPTGLMTFTSGTTVLGTANLNTAGVATINPVLAPGTYSIMATYAGDSNDAGSQSAPLPLTVGQAQTTTTLTVSPDPSTWLQTVTFTAVVAGNGAIPTGTVQFFASGTLIGAAALNTSGVATMTFANLAIGTYSITATYQGDANDAGSTSAAVSLTVGKIPTTTDLGSATTGGSNPQVDLVATVVASVGPVPTGTVTFTNATSTLGTATVDASGHAGLEPACRHVCRHGRVQRRCDAPGVNVATDHCGRESRDLQSDGVAHIGDAQDHAVRRSWHDPDLGGRVHRHHRVGLPGVAAWGDLPLLQPVGETGGKWQRDCAIDH